MGDNPWSSQRKAARSAKRRQSEAYERSFLMDPEELEKEREFDGSEKYKSNKQVR